MSILTSVGDLGARDDVVALMADRPHQIANVGLARMGICHDCFNNPFDCSELDQSLAIVGLIKVAEKPCSAPKKRRPATQRNIEVNKTSIFSLNEVSHFSFSSLTHDGTPNCKFSTEGHILVPFTCEAGRVMWRAHVGPDDLRDQFATIYAVGVDDNPVGRPLDVAQPDLTRAGTSLRRHHLVANPRDESRFRLRLTDLGFFWFVEMTADDQPAGVNHFFRRRRLGGFPSSFSGGGWRRIYNRVRRISSIVLTLIFLAGARRRRGFRDSIPAAESRGKIRVLSTSSATNKSRG